MHTARMQERDFTVKKVVSRNRITKFISYTLDQVTNELSSNNQLFLLTFENSSYFASLERSLNYLLDIIATALKLCLTFSSNLHVV